MSLSTQHPIPSESDRLPTDSELVVQARAGDPLAFEKLFERYNERICLYLIHMVGNDAVGCELTQETFLKAWQALPGFREEARFVNWLYRIATNLAHDHQRRARLIRWLPWERVEEHGSTETMSIAGPEERIAETDLLNIALAQVSLTYRACLILYFVEDLPQIQIAERLGIKANYVSNYVSRGLAELRRIYLCLANDKAVPRKRRQDR